jgi:hypothetical protein
MNDEAIREKSLHALRRFYESYHSTVRRPLWATDALFVMPFGASEPVRPEGLDEIMRESDEFCAKVASHDYFDLAIHQTLDFRGVLGRLSRARLWTRRGPRSGSCSSSNDLRFVDGKIVHRIECFNPLAVHLD